jgi:GTP-binding protein
VHFSYQRYLVNALRERFGFQGTPLRVTYKKKTRKP